MGSTTEQIRQVGAPVAKHGRRQAKGFAAETAAITGESVRDIQRHLARANALGDDLNRIVGTSLDKGVELDALIKLPERERKELIDRAVAGEKVSARTRVDDEFYRVNIKTKTLAEMRQRLLYALLEVDRRLHE